MTEFERQALQRIHGIEHAIWVLVFVVTIGIIAIGTALGA